ncbi:MAG: crosslink repair DNA glycosylase YcaQ family protein [Bacillota bacterium]
MLWRRERLVDLFGFDYTWEIYLKPEKRRFGPYAMPVLEGDRFVGRLDAHLNRADRTLQVDRLTFEPEVEASAERLARVRAAIEALASDLGAERVEYRDDRRA